MRRLTLYLMSLFVLCAQSAGLVHAIGHGANYGKAPVVADAGKRPATDATRASGGAGGPAEEASHCEKCFAFAQLSGAATPSLPALLRVAGAQDATGALAAPLIAAAAPSARNRGPPSIL